MVFMVVKRTVNRKGMGGKYQSIRWKDTFGFSILWNAVIRGLSSSGGLLELIINMESF